MKQVNIKLEESTIAELKIKAIQNGQSFQAFVNEILINFLDGPAPAPEPKPAPKKKEEPKQPAEEYINPLSDEYQNTKTDDASKYYLLRKPVYRGDTVAVTTKFTDGVVEWDIPAGGMPHYDADGNIIPFACTMEFNNKLFFPPFPNEIEEIEEAYGKPVKIEE